MRRKKVWVPAILILSLLAISFVVNLGRQGNQGRTTSSIGSQGCPQILPGPNTSSNVTQLAAAVGENFSLDSTKLFGGQSGGASYHWKQVFSSNSELDYVTSFNSTLLNADKSVATADMATPGNYRFSLTVTQLNGSVATHKVDILATDNSLRKLNTKGIIFSDVFQNLGGPNFQLGPLSEQCQTAQFDSAMAAPARVGAQWVGFVPAAFYSQISPAPVVGSNNSDLSLTNDSYYYALLGSAKAHGFKLVQFEQMSVGPNTPADQIPLLPKMQNSSAWWSSWFDQWKSWLMSQATRAQKAGVDMLVLCLYCESTFRPDVYPQYTQRWDDIIASVRGVFSGKLAMSLIVTDSRFTMYGKLDAVYLTMFPGAYDAAHTFKDPSYPTIQELENQTARLFSYAEFLAGKVQVYYIFLAYSSVGQYTADPPPWGNNPPPSNLTDFRQQAMYYEAFFKVLQNETWVSGVFSERWDYFDHFARVGGAPDAYYFDETIGDSPRDKPAEQVVRLWFGML